MKNFYIIIFLSAFTVSLASASEQPESITLYATVRDFCGIGFRPGTCPSGYFPHPDFENLIELDQGVVSSELGEDGLPVPVAKFPTATITSEKSFGLWFRDEPGVNLKKIVPLTFKEVTPGSKVYSYDNSAFFPIDNELLGNQGRDHNYSFTLSLYTTFTYQPGQVFSFTADDDLWVFINKRLVVDQGGVHVPLSSSVELDELGLEPGQLYSFDLFFAERHTSLSTLKLQTSIAFEDQAE